MAGEVLHGADRLHALGEQRRAHRHHHVVRKRDDDRAGWRRAGTIPDVDVDDALTEIDLAD
jgi:hypothetical protein